MLEPIRFSLTKAEDELNSFKSWLFANPFFPERAVVKEITARPNMACLSGYSIVMPKPDLIKFEFDIKGMFRADLVVGCDAARKFVLVEFEGGEENSLFSGGPKAYRHWSRQLEHGVGQVIDWAWAKHSAPHDPVLENAFCGKIIEDHYMVVCGRRPRAGSLEEKRFDFRRARTSVNGVTVQLKTYDDMIQDISCFLEALRWG